MPEQPPKLNFKKWFFANRFSWFDLIVIQVIVIVFDHFIGR